MAGGEGSRLRPLTSTRPKPLVTVVNRPILWHVLRLVSRHGIRESFVTLHYLSDQITTAFSDENEVGVRLNYSFEDRPLGTAGSVKAIEGELSNTFLVISGDVMTDFDLSELIRFHKKSGALVTIGLARVPNPLEYGIVLASPEGKISKFLEKPGWSEVFSDTVNSGIYVIEPEALRQIENDRACDFSKELFPKLLRADEPIFAHVLDGYWCDVGMPSQYIGAHHDILSGKSKVEIPGKLIGDRIWVEEGTDIKPGVSLIGPCLIGARTTIGRGSKIGPLSCIGSDVSIEQSATITHSVIYDFSYIGRAAEAKGCVVGKKAVLKPGSRVFEGSIIGDGVQLGTRSEVAREVRVWPDKKIESGAVLRENLVWGLAWQRNIFGSRGIVGIPNVEITPEITAKLGASFGTFAGQLGKVAVARDTLRSSRMLKRSFIAGLLSSGNSAFNLNAAPLPLMRLSVVSSKLDGGVYFGTNPSEPDHSILQFTDSKGYNLTVDAQKKIENILIKEEIHRASYEELSDIFYLPQLADAYSDLVLKCIDSKTIENAHPRIVVDCALGPSSLTAPNVLSKLGCEVLALNASLGTYATTLSVSSSPANLRDIVTAVGAVAGFRIGGSGDTLRVVDETGEVLDGDETLMLMSEILFRLHPGTMSIPISSSRIMEAVGERYGQKVVRLKTEARALMESVGNGNAMFSGNEVGEFVVSRDFPFPDGLIAAGKVVEYLSSTGAKIHDIRKGISRPQLARGSVAVPWNERGKIMRKLASDYAAKRVETLEGIKLVMDEGWILINPSIDEPVFDITVESEDIAAANRLLETFRVNLSKVITGNSTGIV